MRWGPLVGWGVVTYAIGALVWLGFNIWKYADVPGSHAAVYLAVALTALVAGRSLRFASWKDIFPYSLAWAIEFVLLDALYNVPLYGWSIYHDPEAWIVYGIVLLVPLLAPSFRRVPEPPVVS